MIKFLKKRTGRVFNMLLGQIGFQIVRRERLIDVCLHEFDSYEEYQRVQTFHNKRKIDKVWADVNTLSFIAGKINEAFLFSPLIEGVCHGSRNGFEQKFFNEYDGERAIKAIGTDISDSALNFADSVVWDFHEPKPEWFNRFHFVYSNSLDHAWNPKRAVDTWLNQLRDEGILVLELTDTHGPLFSSSMDPFGVRPIAFPFVLTEWFGDTVKIEHFKVVKSSPKIESWLFFIKRT